MESSLEHSLSQHTTNQCRQVVAENSLGPYLISLGHTCCACPALWGEGVVHADPKNHSLASCHPLEQRLQNGALLLEPGTASAPSCLCSAVTAALCTCWQQGAPHHPVTHGHLLIAHYSFIELEQDSCYGWTATLALCKPRLMTPAGGRPQ